MSLEETQTPEVEVVEQVDQTQVEQEAAPVSDDAAFEHGFNAAQGVDDTPPEPPKEEPEAAYTNDQVKDLMDTVAALKQRETKVFGAMGGPF